MVMLVCGGKGLYSHYNNGLHLFFASFSWIPSIKIDLDTGVVTTYTTGVALQLAV